MLVDESKAQLLASLSQDRVRALDALFGEQHEDATPAFHVQMVELWSAADEYVLIEGFRESGKTTLALEFLTLEALFGNFRFGLFIADNATKACEKLEIVKWQLKTNDKIISLFGQCIGEKDNEAVLHLKNGVRIQAMGREQSPRGLLHHIARPDRIYIDDPENRERGDVSSTERVDDTMKWLYGDVIPAMDKRNGKIRINSTPQARDCMVTRLKNDSAWVRRTYPIVSGDIDADNAVALWPARYPMHWIRRQRDMFQTQGMLTQFMQEYMCQAEEESEKIFPSSDFQELPSLKDDWLPIYATFDPARTSKKTSNLTGLCVFSWVGSQLFVIESSGERLQPSQIISRLFDVHEKYAPVGIGIESNSLEEFLMEPLRQEMVRRKTVIPLVELRAPPMQSKHDFIKSLQPFHRAGNIILVGGKKNHERLLMEMTTFPSRNDDVVNALAYATKMRTGEPVYPDFSPDNVVADTAPARGTPVHVAYNSNGKETTAIAFQLIGQNLSVLEEWAIPGNLNDAVASIRMACAGLFTRDRVLPFCPADLFDDWNKTPLVRMMRDNRLVPNRGGYLRDSRGALSSYVRTVIKGTRALTVSSHCKITLAAFAAGYALPVSPTGRLSDVAVDNIYRCLIEGLESVVALLNASSQKEVGNYAVSGDGARYLTSRPGITFRR